MHQIRTEPDLADQVDSLSARRENRLGTLIESHPLDLADPELPAHERRGFEDRDVEIVTLPAQPPGCGQPRNPAADDHHVGTLGDGVRMSHSLTLPSLADRYLIDTYAGGTLVPEVTSHRQQVDIAARTGSSATLARRMP